MTGPARVLVTRPAAQAATWVERLRTRGVDAEALPLIDISPVDDVTELRTAWLGLPARRLVVFVSANAVSHFFAQRPQGAAWPSSLEAAVPGPGTADAVRAAGGAGVAVVAPAADAEQFDSEALWARLHGRDWRGASVLIVRGDGGRDWLVERLAEAGAQVDTVRAYQRGLPKLAGVERQRLDDAIVDSTAIWLFSSSEAIANLEHLAGAGRWTAARAVATHPRIAGQARAAGFGVVVEAGPRLDAVVACIQSMGP